MSIGINIAEKNIYTSSKEINNKPIIFLSHKSEDKDFVEAVGKYIMNAGLNIYLDKYDSNLQRATETNNPKIVTECIQKGIESCTYILCIVSEKTKNSWWVPYEIGYGKMAKKGIATLCKSDIISIPDYLKIEELFQKIDDLNDFITKISSKYSLNLSEEYYWYTQKPNTIIQSSTTHELANYLRV